MQVHTPRGKCSIDDYVQPSLALLIPCSRLNARNAPGARLYCNRQPENCADQTKPREFLHELFLT